MSGFTLPPVPQQDPKVPCPRQAVSFRCPAGHDFTLEFAEEVAAPETFTCRCGRDGHQGDTPSEADRARIRRNEHWARVLERRTIAELETLLAETLERVRADRDRVA